MILCNTCFFFSDTATTELYTLSLHDALPICGRPRRPTCRPETACGTRSRRSRPSCPGHTGPRWPCVRARSEEHTSELQSRGHLVCRLLLEKKKPSELNAVNQLPHDRPGRPDA